MIEHPGGFMSATVGKGKEVARPRVMLWPFTSPLTDVRLYFLLLPLFWVAGIEQMVPLFWGWWAFLKLTLSRRKIRVPIPARIAALFLMWQWVSSTSIDASTDWLVFIKNFLSYSAGILFFLLIVNTVRTQKDFNRMLFCVIVFSAVVSFVGLGFVIGILPATFQSPGRQLIPSFLKRSSFVQSSVLWRTLGRNAILGQFAYRRVSSIFLYPAQAAQAYVLVIPLQVFLVKKLRGWRRLTLLFLLILSVVVFILTTTRTTILLLPPSAIIVLLIRNLTLCRHPLERIPFLFAALVIAIGVVSLFLLLGGLNFLSEFFVESRANSFAGRMRIYQITFDSWKQHPLIGWGTQREVPDSSVRLPMGTHSEYFGFLYRYGLIGLLLHWGVYATVWLRLLHLLSAERRKGNRRAFLTSSATGLLAFNLNGVAHGLDWDVTIPLLLWTMIGLFYSLRQGPQRV